VPLLFSSQYRGGARYAREPDMSLRRAFSFFVREQPPRMILIVLGITIALRLWVGGWSRWDLIPVVALPIVHPFAEWLIHVLLLHSKPRQIAGRRFDFFSARNHRMHHRDPWDCRFTVMPLQTATGFFVASTVGWYLGMPTFGSFLSGVLAVQIAGLVYEWTHFLIHTSYRPRSAHYRHLWRMHRLHHFKNEHYWMCVVAPIGDRVLGTNPDPDAVESSPTARTLGVEADDEGTEAAG